MTRPYTCPVRKAATYPQCRAQEKLDNSKFCANVRPGRAALHRKYRRKRNDDAVMLLMSNSVAPIADAPQLFKKESASALSPCLQYSPRTFGLVAVGHMPAGPSAWEESRKTRFRSLIASAGDGEPRKKKKKKKRRRKIWWQKFLLQEIDASNWFGRDFGPGDEISSYPDGSMEEEPSEMVEDGEGFEAWKQRADAVMELREFQENGRNPNGRDWEDWLDDSWTAYSSYVGGEGWDDDESSDWDKEGSLRGPPRLPERAVYGNFRDWLARAFDDADGPEPDLIYEDKVFQFASRTTVRFVAVLLLVPWAVDFVVHDYLVVPFLNRYVEVVPLAAQLLDVRKYQKLEMIDTLKQEKLRMRFRAEIGRAPPLSEEEVGDHLRHKARELREELRLENRKSFANIWSDAVAGISAFLILAFNKSKVELMKFTGYRMLTNISDTGKAFLLILITDIFLGYHSESGWRTLLETLVEHYGVHADRSAITIFICTVPVTIDVCVKLWVFKYLPRLSPTTAATFHEMKRH